MKAGKKLLRSLSEYAEKKISIHRSCGSVVVEIDRIIGISLVEVARQEGISTFAISEALDRTMKD